MTGQDTFGSVALAYVDAGWSIFPLPSGKKSPPPAGRTGPHEDASRDVIEKEIITNAGGNLGVRLDHGLIGLDVDDYDGKPGAATLEQLIKKCGELPDTIMVTSREGGQSGIRIFRVPEGTKLITKLPGIELIQRHHRYAVSWPSVHPDTGRVYRWYRTGTGKPYEGVPDRSDIAELPAAWVEELQTARTTKTKINGTSIDQVDRLLARWCQPGEPCRHMADAITKAQTSVALGNARHDSALEASLSIVRFGEAGHPGGRTALAQLKAWFISSLDGDRDGTEWRPMLTGAVRVIESNPTPEDRKGCPSEEGPEFWEARPILAYVFTYARARRVSPWATLGAVLARTLAATPPTVVLPNIIGSVGSLNLYIANVAASGGGKDAALSTARDAVAFKNGTPLMLNVPDLDLYERALGTGQGLISEFASVVKIKDEEGKDTGGTEVQMIRDSVIFKIGEIDQLKSHASMQGANIMPTLTDGWSSNEIGGAYRDKKLDLMLKPHSYRLCLIANVQPSRAAVLLDDHARAGGLPQRFIWLPAIDPDMPDVAPECPEPLTVWLPMFGTGREEMEIAEVIKNDLHADRLIKGRGQDTGDPLDSHLLFCQEKIAAAFALLDSRTKITGEDWELAKVVISRSRRTRSEVINTLITDESEKSKTRRASVVKTAVESDKAVREQTISQVAESITKRFPAGEWIVRSKARRLIDYKYREMFDLALDLLGGRVERIEEPGRTRTPVVKYRLLG